MALKVDDIRVLDESGKKELLGGISFTLENSSLTLLLGQTGAGKSTLLDALSGLTPIESGAILYDDLPLWSGKHLNREVLPRFGHVFQMPEQQLFARTVQKEFAFSLQFMKLPRQEIVERSRAAMEHVGLPSSFLDRPPLFMSGGEKRRVALATTFCIEPEWLLLDEPTAGMDPPSVRQLVQWLEDWKQNTEGSAIVATHQAEEFLPIADRFLFLRDGRLIADVDREQLVRQPHLWEEAQLDMPPSLSVAETLRAKGVDVPYRILPPQEMAKIILCGRSARQEAAPMGEDQEKESYMDSRLDSCELDDASDIQLNSDEKDDSSDSRSNPDGLDLLSDSRFISRMESERDSSWNLQANSLENTDPHLLPSLDPRVKWLVYVLFSIAVLMQNDWWGVLAGAVVAVGWHDLSGLKLAQVLRLCKPFLLFTAISFLVAGIQFPSETAGDGSEVRFAMESAMLVLFRMSKIGVAMFVGIVFALTTSFYRMKLGLEQSLDWFRKFRLPVREFALTAALMIRFVPVLQQELNKFSRIVRARGKDHRHSTVLRMRQMPALMIPLMLSLLQWASDLTLALLARGAGFSSHEHQNIRSHRLRMRRIDVIALLAGIGMISVLVAWRLLRS